MPVVEAAAVQVAAVRVPVPVPAPQPEQVPEARDLRLARGPEWAPHPAAPVRGRQPLRGWGRVPRPQAPTSTPTGARAIRTFSRRLRTARRRQRRKPRGTLAPAMRPMDCRSAARAPGPAMKIRNSPVPIQDGSAPSGPLPPLTFPLMPFRIVTPDNNRGCGLIPGWGGRRDPSCRQRSKSRMRIRSRSPESALH